MYFLLALATRNMSKRSTYRDLVKAVDAPGRPIFGRRLYHSENCPQSLLRESVYGFGNNPRQEVVDCRVGMADASNDLR